MQSYALSETCPLQEIKKHVFFKIAILFIPITQFWSYTVINYDFWTHLEELGEFIGVRIPITKRRLEHLTFSTVMTKHWNICDSAAKTSSPLSTNIAIFLSDQNILKAWQTNFKDITKVVRREAGLSNPGIDYKPGQIQYFLSHGSTHLSLSHSGSTTGAGDRSSG